MLITEPLLPKRTDFGTITVILIVPAICKHPNIWNDLRLGMRSRREVEKPKRRRFLGYPPDVWAKLYEELALSSVTR